MLDNTVFIRFVILDILILNQCLLYSRTQGSPFTKNSIQIFVVLDALLFIAKNNCGLSYDPNAKTIRLAAVASVARGEAAACGETVWADV